MNTVELLKVISVETGLTQKDLACCFSVKEKEIRQWKKKTAMPSKYQVQNILHFASLYGIDISSFSWEQYIDGILQIVYDDEYRIDKGIDEKLFTVHLSRIDGCEGYVPIEDITNKKKDLFKCK